MKTTLPTIHINGTGRNALESDYRAVRAKLRETIAAFDAVEFNGRDYYPQGPKAFTAAREERQAAFKLLTDFDAYLMAHLEHICAK